MVGKRALNAYRNMEKQAEIHPVKLIHMLYERLLVHLELAEEGIREDSPRKRGENLGKAIAIVTELSTSIKGDDDSEAAAFLRGLYAAILTELPKVAISHDVTILQRARGYMARLKEIWEQTAMLEAGEEVAHKTSRPTVPQPMPEGEYEAPSRVAVAGVSVSI
ncbi:MAG: flagellar export chaperone FliS [Thermodesulfobacteriota bacterium]